MIDLNLRRVNVLVAMHDEAFSRTGWSRRGVRGWRFREELETALDTSLPEVLPYLACRGWLDRVDVREPGRGQPVWIYRISQQGARALEEMVGWDRHRIPEALPCATDDDLQALYAPAGAWYALSVLQRQTELVGAVRRFGVPGWMSAAEVRRTSTEVLPKHLEWLLERRLVERRRPVDEAGAPGAQWLYRTSALGMRAEIVDAPRIGVAPPLFVLFRICEDGIPGPRDVEVAWESLIATKHSTVATRGAPRSSEGGTPRLNRKLPGKSRSGDGP